MVALGAGAAREPLLLLTVGGAAACIFFSAPNLAALLIITPAAAAAPLLALYVDPATQATGRLALGGIALVMALSLILNRLLRRMFTLANEHEALVEERARSLDEAERLAKTKTDLVDTLSQEIRTGLTGIAHTLGAARSAGGTRSARREGQLNAALGSAQELIAVLNATLDTVSAESGVLALEHRPFDIAALARDAVLDARPLANAKGLELDVHVDDGLAVGAVVADETRTRQILANLIGNAIKYTVRGRIEVRLDPPTGGRIRLEVADTGPGLTPEELELAFQPFQRIARTGARRSAAGAWPVAVAAASAVLMKGEVTAESAVGVGSCFRLDLPFVVAVRVDPPAPAPEVQPAAGRAARSLRVLIAEDDPLNAAMLRAALEQLGHNVLHAQDGRRAVDLAQVCDVDLIMLDGHMPEIGRSRGCTGHPRARRRQRPGAHRRGDRRRRRRGQDLHRRWRRPGPAQAGQCGQRRPRHRLCPARRAAAAEGGVLATLAPSSSPPSEAKTGGGGFAHSEAERKDGGGDPLSALQTSTDVTR